MPLPHRSVQPVDLRVASPRRRLAAGAFVLALSAVALSACEKSGEDPSDVAAAAERGLREREATKVVAAAVERREMVRMLETTSVVESEAEIDVVPRAAGIVVELFVEEGDRVEAEEVLARLDDREEVLALRDAAIALEEARQAVDSADVAVAEAESRIAGAERAFEQAERDYQRDVALRTGGANPYGSVSEKMVEASRLTRDQAEQDLAQARLALQRATVEAAGSSTAVTRAEVTRDRAELALQRMSIKAPIGGRVASRTVRVGGTVDMGTAAFRITDASRLRTVFYRPQRELALFRTAGDGSGSLELTATAEAVPGVVFRGLIERTSPTIDPTSGSFRVTAQLDRHPEGGPDAGVLLPGMLVRVRIVTDRRPDALAVVKRAVRREGERAFVQVVADGSARRVTVTEGYSDDDWVELRLEPGAELDAGDLVIVVGGRDLEEGDPVAVEARLEDGETVPVDGAVELDATLAEGADGAESDPTETTPAETTPAEAASAEDGATNGSDSELASDVESTGGGE